jgi:hypothetical protein
MSALKLRVKTTYKILVDSLSYSFFFAGQPIQKEKGNYHLTAAKTRMFLKPTKLLESKILF